MPAAEPLLPPAAPDPPKGLGRHAHLLWLLLITAIGGVLRFHNLDQPPLWGDEAFTWSRICGSYTQLLEVLRRDAFTPLHYSLYWWIHAGFPLPYRDAAGNLNAYPLFSDGIRMTPFVMRAPVAVAGTLMIPAVYWLARELLGRRVALLAAVLTATSAYMLHYSRDAKMYMNAWLFVAVSFAACLWFMRTGKRHAWYVWIIAATLAMGFHMVAALVIGLQVLVALIHPRLTAIRAVAILLGVSIACAGPAVYFKVFNKWARDATSSDRRGDEESAPKIDLSDLNRGDLNWIREYNAGRTTSQQLLQNATAMLFSYEWPKDNRAVRERIDPAVMTAATAAVGLLAFWLAIGALPWPAYLRGTAARPAGMLTLGDLRRRIPFLGGIRLRRRSAPTGDAATATSSASAASSSGSTYAATAGLPSPASSAYTSSATTAGSPSGTTASLSRSAATATVASPASAAGGLGWFGAAATALVVVLPVYGIYLRSRAPEPGQPLAGGWATPADAIQYLARTLESAVVAVGISPAWLDRPASTFNLPASAASAMLALVVAAALFAACHAHRYVPRLLAGVLTLAIAAVVASAAYAAYTAPPAPIDAAAVFWPTRLADAAFSNGSTPAWGLPNISALFVLAAATILPALCAHAAGTTPRSRLASAAKFLVAVAVITALCHGLAAGAQSLLASERAKDPYARWQDNWMPRYLAVIWPALAVGVAALLLRVPTATLRFAAIASVVGINLVAGLARIHARSEPPVDLATADLWLNRTSPKTTRTFFNSSPENAHPSLSWIGGSTGRYYLYLRLALDAPPSSPSGRPAGPPVTPAEVRGSWGIPQRFQSLLADSAGGTNFPTPARLARFARANPTVDRLILWDRYMYNRSLPASATATSPTDPADPYAIALGPDWSMRVEVFPIRFPWTWALQGWARRREFTRTGTSRIETSPPAPTAPAAPSPSPSFPAPPATRPARQPTIPAATTPATNPAPQPTPPAPVTRPVTQPASLPTPAPATRPASRPAASMPATKPPP